MDNSLDGICNVLNKAFLQMGIEKELSSYETYKQYIYENSEDDKEMAEMMVADGLLNVNAETEIIVADWQGFKKIHIDKLYEILENI